MAPQIELMLTTAATEPGQAAVVKDGKPVYTVDGAELPLDYGHLRGELAKANAEAQTRREALEKLAQSLNLEVDVRNEEGLKALLARVESVPTEAAELETLRVAKEAGKLDETADQKIKALAATQRAKEFDELQRQLQEAKTAQGQLKTKADAAMASLHNNQVTTALRAAYDQIEGLRENTLETYLTVARQDHGGYKWRPTGEENAAGIATLAMMDDSGNIRMGPDGVTPLSPKAWGGSELKARHSVLFKPTNGGPPGANPDGSPMPGKPANEYTPEELDAAARKAYG